MAVSTKVLQRLRDFLPCIHDSIEIDCSTEVSSNLEVMSKTEQVVANSGAILSLGASADVPQSGTRTCTRARVLPREETVG